MTMHGFALNVSADLEPFRSINPCGMADCPVTSLAELTGVSLTIEEVKAAVGRCFDPLLRECLPVPSPGVTQDDAAGMQ